MESIPVRIKMRRAYKQRCWHGGGPQGQFTLGHRGSLPQAPSVRGVPNSAELFQIGSSSSSTFQSSFFMMFVSLYFVNFKSACFFASRLRCWRMHPLSYVTTAQPLTMVPYVVLFDLKPLNEDGNWQVYMYCMKRSLLNPPEHTSEHVKSRNFLGACTQTPLKQSIVWAPLFVFAPGPHNPLGGPAYKPKKSPFYSIFARQLCDDTLLGWLSPFPCSTLTNI